MPSPDSPEKNDPIRHGAQIIAGAESDVLERRIKQDIYNSLCRIKPEISEHDFESEMMTGDLLPELSAPLQGIAIAKMEGALAFYNRIGWSLDFLKAPLANCIDAADMRDVLENRYHARNLHDLAYVHPKHFEKILGKPGAASLWESLKREAGRAESANSTLNNTPED